MHNVRKAVKDDVLEVRAFVHHTIRRTDEYSPSVQAIELDHCSVQQIQTAIFDELCFVYTIHEKIVGVVYGEEDCGMIWLSWIVVDPCYRRMNIANELLNALLADDLNNTHKVVCSSLTTNSVSNGFLRYAGFSPVVTLKRHWHQLDFYLWEKILQK